MSQTLSEPSGHNYRLITVLKTQLRLYDWVHHYEKMLYDNALLARVYLHAWQVTYDSFYKRIVQETLDFVANEMANEQGGFYSSLDADSEDEEGKFYVWTQDEIKNILGNEYGFFEAAYGITSKGNWEGKTILQRALDDATLASRFKLDPETVAAKLSESHSKLYTARAMRIRPSTDDKILTAWNGLMLAAFAESARAFADEPSQANIYLNMATRSSEFLLTHLRPGGNLRRAWRDGRTTNQVFLEDYAALILGLLELYQTDFNTKWFSIAKELADEMIAKFHDPDGGFFDIPNDAEELLVRPKDVQDNATPSGNSLACEALVKLAALTDEGRYRDLAEEALKQVTGFVLRYPLGFARWLSAAENALGTMKQVAVMGDAGEENFERMLKTLRADYRPGMVVAATSYPIQENAPALLHDRGLVNGKATAYVCEGFVCKQPVTEIDALIEQLNS